MLINIHPDNPNIRDIRKIVDILLDGGIVIYPTDTVYGLGCDMKNSRAIEKIARVKGLSQKKMNLSIICHDMAHLSEYTKAIDRHTFKLLKRSLPGPFTFILPASNNVTRLFENNKKTIGFRIPDNPIILDIVRMLENPILNTSIRDEDEVLSYMTDPQLIHEKYSRVVDAVIDGGYGGNVGSTIVDCTTVPFEITRQGKGILSE